MEMKYKETIQYRDKVFDRAEKLWRMAWDISITRREKLLPLDTNSYLILAHAGIEHGVDDNRLMEYLDVFYNNEKRIIHGVTAAYLAVEMLKQEIGKDTTQ